MFQKVRIEAFLIVELETHVQYVGGGGIQEVGYIVKNRGRSRGLVSKEQDSPRGIVETGSGMAIEKVRRVVGRPQELKRATDRKGGCMDRMGVRKTYYVGLRLVGRWRGMVLV